MQAPNYAFGHPPDVALPEHANSVWADTLLTAHNHAPLSGSETADVVVIGEDLLV